MKYFFCKELAKILVLFIFWVPPRTSLAQDPILTIPLRLNEVNIYAARYFSKNCKSALNQIWYNTSIGNQVVYEENGIRSNTIFNQLGEFEYTIRFLGTKDLPESIIAKITKTFPGFEVYSINEIDIEKATTYLISIKQKNTLKFLTVNEGEMQLFAGFQITGK
jgi:hypothetical protein